MYKHAHVFTHGRLCPPIKNDSAAILHAWLKSLGYGLRPECTSPADWFPQTAIFSTCTVEGMVGKHSLFLTFGVHLVEKSDKVKIAWRYLSSYQEFEQK